MMGNRLFAVLVVLGLVAAACGADDPINQSEPEPTSDVGDESGEPSETEAGETAPATDKDEATRPEISGNTFGLAPLSPSGPLATELEADLDALFDSLTTLPDLEALDRIGASGDPRVAWLLTDIIRFVRAGDILQRTGAAWESLTGVSIPAQGSVWGFTTDHMIAWDVPAPPGYINWKRQLFELWNRAGHRCSTTPTPSSTGAGCHGAGCTLTTAPSTRPMLVARRAVFRRSTIQRSHLRLTVRGIQTTPSCLASSLAMKRWRSRKTSWRSMRWST